MTIISESQIDEIAEKVGADELAFGQNIQAFQESEPILFGYLFTESFEVLTNSEREYLLFLASIIWAAIDQNQEHIPEITTDLIAEKEENNWTVFQSVKAADFRSHLDIFFEQTRQEDLLAFIEDALTTEEEEEISNEGKEVLFITLKTIMDCLLEE